jgi:hypothetical protein
MFSLFSSFKRMLSYLFGREAGTASALPEAYRKPFKTHHTFSAMLPPPPPTAPLLPDFEFRPAECLLEAMGEGTTFVVANPVDLALQSQNLMANVLVVEVRGLDPAVSSEMLWFRFDSFALSTRGMSICRLFVDYDQSDVISPPSAERPSAMGVCGWVVDRKRM